MAKTCKFYKLQQQVSFDCADTWEGTELVDKGNLYEINSTDCGFMLIYQWALSEGDYDCDSVRKYNVEVLQFTTEQGGEYQNVVPEYKRRRAHDIVDYLSEDCGYVESTGAFKFSGTSVVECGSTYINPVNPQRLARGEVYDKIAPHSIVGDCTEIIGEGAFSGSTLQTIDISSYTKEIEDSAFAYCSGITNITIPDSVEKIRYGLFSDCQNLTGATLPSGITYIPSGIFSSTGIENYVVPNGVKLIGDYAFVGGNGWWHGSGRTQDLDITFSTGVTDVGDMAFAGRNFNGNLSLPSSLKYIGEESFRSCVFGKELELPEGVEHIDFLFITMDYPDTTGLGENISIPGSVKVIQLPYMFNYNYSEPAPEGEVYAEHYITSITLNEGTEVVTPKYGEHPEYPYVNPPYNLPDFNIPSSLLFLLDEYGGGGFHRFCDGSIDGEYIIPENVLVINGIYRNGGRMYNKRRGAVTFLSPTPPALYGDTATGSYGGIFVPDNSVELYKQVWSDMASYIKPLSWKKYDWRVVPIESEYECVGVDKHYKEYMYLSTDSGATWTKTCKHRAGDLYEANSTDCGYVPQNHTLVLTYNDGKIDSVTTCEVTTVPVNSNDATIKTASFGTCARVIPTDCFYQCSGMTTLHFENGVTSIGNNAFGRCYSLTSVTIPDSVTSIGNYVFSDCTSLTSCTIGSGVTSIGNDAFTRCTSLTSVNIPSGITSINEGVFYYCTSLTNVNIPSGVTSIGSLQIPSSGVFEYCTNLTGVTIPDSVTTIGYVTFNGCTSLTSINIPDSVTSIGERAFQGCSGATSVTIGSGLTSINNYVFNGCTSLSSATIPDSVTNIGRSAFYQCSSLTSVTIGSGITSIGDYAFFRCGGLTSMTITATTPPTLGSDAFIGTNNCPIYVPSASVDAYKAASGWWNYSSRIQAIP